MERFETAADRSILFGSSQILAQGVSLGLSFHLHYFSAPPEHFLEKELSEIFAPIPGGGHATFRAELFWSQDQQWSRSTRAFSRATALAR
jgi:hypothetical protein